MFIILAETHKLIAKEIYDIVLSKYDINLNLDKLKWGSVAPDVLPYYKLKRHYKDESIHYISKEIIGIISLSKYYRFQNNENSFFTKFISNRLGVIMHYLCDYTTYPHAHRLTFLGNMKNHIRYESELNSYAKSHLFTNLDLNINKIEIFNKSSKCLFDKIEDYINEVVEEYMNKVNSFSNDLDYALYLSVGITEFIIESIMNYSEEMDYQFI